MKYLAKLAMYKDDLPALSVENRKFADVIVLAHARSLVLNGKPAIVFTWDGQVDAQRVKSFGATFNPLGNYAFLYTDYESYFSRSGGDLSGVMSFKKTVDIVVDEKAKPYSPFVGASL